MTLQHHPGTKKEAADGLKRCMRGSSNSPQTTKEQIQEILDTEQYRKNLVGQLILNKADIYLVAKQAFEEIGHMGPRALYQTLTPIIYKTNLKQICIQIKGQYTRCNELTKRKANYGILKGDLQTDTPFAHISSDIVGPFWTHEFPGNHQHIKFWICTIIDRCTRWTQLYRINNITPQAIIQCLKL